MKKEAACRIQARKEQSINMFHAVVFWVMATQGLVSGQHKHNAPIFRTKKAVCSLRTSVPQA
jgi:hypothetical protein